jgi:hypothetical protein
LVDLDDEIYEHTFSNIITIIISERTEIVQILTDVTYCDLVLIVFQLDTIVFQLDSEQQKKFALGRQPLTRICISTNL